MEQKIKNYLLEWKLEQNEGNIVIIFEDDNNIVIENLKHTTFNCVVNVLRNNNPIINRTTNEIYNKLT